MECVDEPDGTPGWRRIKECEYDCSRADRDCVEPPEREPTRCDERTAYCDGAFLVECVGRLATEATDCSGDASVLTCIELADGSARCDLAIDAGACAELDDGGRDDDAGAECSRAP